MPLAPSPFVLRFALLAVLLAGPAGGREGPAVGASGAEAAGDPRAELVAVLDGDLPADRAGMHLARLGPAVLPPAFELLVEGRRDAPGRSLTAREEELLVVCVRGLGRAPVGAFLLERSAQGWGERELAVALRLLGEVGRAPELTLAVELARGGTGGSSSTRIAVALEEAVRAVLGREPACLVELRGPVRDARFAAVRGPLLRSVSAVSGPSALDFLGGLVRESVADAELARAVLAELGKAGERVRFVDDEPTLAAVRKLLRDGTSFAVLREAAVAAGRLGDHEAVPALVGLLDHAERGVREGAHRSLVRLTGRAQSAEAGAWRSWLAEETRWFEEDAPALLAGLDRRPAGEAVAALAEIARHRLHAGRLSREAARALTHPGPGVRRLACAVIGQLGACADPGILVPFLGDSSQEVADEAWAALRALTGWSLPPDADLWVEALRAGSPDALLAEGLERPAPGRASAFARL